MAAANLSRSVISLSRSSSLPALSAAPLAKPQAGPDPRQNVEQAKVEALENEDDDYYQQITTSNLCVSLVMSVLFMTICILENPVENVYQMHENILLTYVST